MADIIRVRGVHEGIQSGRVNKSKGEGTFHRSEKDRRDLIVDTAAEMCLLYN